MRAAPLVERLTAPLDGVRAGALRLAVARPALLRLLADKDRRIAAQATLGVLVALALTAAAPMLLLCVSPILLGVPHVASDVRYLLVRPSLPRAWVVTAWSAIGVLVALRVTDALAGRVLPVVLVEGGVAFAWMFAGAFMGVAVSGRARRLSWMLPVLLALAAAAAAAPRLANVIFLQLHNLVAVALWVVLFRRARRVALLPLAVLAVAMLVLLSGVTGPGGSFAGLGLDEAAARIAPYAPATLAARLTVLFVFLQAVHYGVWLAWIPAENTRCEGTLSWRQTARGLGRDFGGAGLLAIGLAVVVVLAGALHDLHGTRALYLSLANFHGILEVASLCFFVAARR